MRQMVCADESGRLFLSPGPAGRRWGADSRSPGPGVVTVQRTLKLDIPRILTQHEEKKNQWALCGVETVESILLANGPAPSHLSPLSGAAAASRRPAVATAGLESRRPCGHLLGSSLFIDTQWHNNSSADDETSRRLASD